MRFTRLVKLSSLPVHFHNDLHMPISLREEKQSNANSPGVSLMLEFFMSRLRLSKMEARKFSLGTPNLYKIPPLM